MATYECHTQKQLDAALKKAGPYDVVAVLGDGWFRVEKDQHVEARESSHVEARESSHVEAWGSSHVVAWGSSHVVAWGSSHVVAWGSSHVEARGSSHVEARESSHVEASKFVSVTSFTSQLYGKPTISGGVLIEIPKITTAAEWCDYYGVEVVDGYATVYKALEDDFSTGYARAAGIFYRPGTDKVRAPDWKKTKACGNGLHVSPHPVMAKPYNQGATRYVSLRAKVSELVVIDDKAKAPRLYGPIVEVDERRRPVEAKAA